MKNLKEKMRWRLVGLLALICVVLAGFLELGRERLEIGVQSGETASAAAETSLAGRRTNASTLGDVRDLSVFAAGPVSGQPLSSGNRMGGRRDVRTGERLKGRVVPVHIPPVAQFKGLKEGMKILMPSFDGEVLEGTLNYVETGSEGVVWLAGDLVGREGTFFWKRAAGEFSGMAMLTGIETAVELKRDGDRTVMMEKRLGAVLCRRYPGVKKSAVKSSAGSVGAGASVVPLLYSVSGEVLEVGGDAVKGRPVLYLDFDGEVVKHPRWNGGRTIVAARPNLNDSDIRQIVSEVAADFSPFSVVVTTDVSLLQESRSAGFNTMRCIVTPTSDAAPGAGGVAFLDSFPKDSGETDPLGVPCWAFNGSDRLTGIGSCAMTISHELGHTFGLIHDGDTSPAEEYNAGFGAGAFSWGPIMGAPFGKKVVQWSRGEYGGANNTEDDLAIIRTNPAQASIGGGLGYQADEADGMALPSSYGLVNHVGVIAGGGDTDVYRLELKKGDLQITASPVGENPNLDVKLELLDESGNLVVSGGGAVNPSNPPDALDASINYAVSESSLVGGKLILMLRVSGVGRGNPASGGYSSYGSIGAYRLVGSAPTVDAAPPEILDPASFGKVEWALDGKPCSWSLKQVQNAPSAFSLEAVAGYDRIPPGCSFDSKAGEIGGTPTVSGVYRSRIIARNSVGTSSAYDVEITVRRKMVSPSNLLWVEGVPSSYKADFGAMNPTNLPIIYSISPSLPSGLSFDKTTGVLSGTVVGGAVYNGVIQASGANGFYAGGGLKVEGVKGASVLDDVGGRLKTFTARGWKVDLSERVTGLNSMVSDVTEHGSSSWMRAETTESGWLTFSWKVDSDRAGDFLSFIVNGRKMMSISGNRPWQEFSYYLSSGNNVLEWVYEKDASEQSGRDCAWVDAIQFGNRVSLLSHPKAQAVSEGAPIELSCSVTGSDAEFQWYVDGRPINHGGRWSIATGSSSGVTQSRLKIDKAIASDVGLYSAKITSRAGARPLFSEKARVMVNGVPRLVRALQPAAVSGGMGGSVSFSAGYATGDGLLYEWSVAGVRVPGPILPPCFSANTKAEVITGPSGSTLRISNLAGRLNTASYPVRLEVRPKTGGARAFQDTRLTVTAAKAN